MIRVIIAEDEAAIRRGLIHCIRWDELGLELAAEAENGRQALDFLIASPVDILITDMRMPECDGRQLLREIEKRALNCEILVLSAAPTPATRSPRCSAQQRSPAAGRTPRLARISPRTATVLFFSAKCSHARPRRRRSFGKARRLRAAFFSCRRSGGSPCCLCCPGRAACAASTAGGRGFSRG